MSKDLFRKIHEAKCFTVPEALKAFGLSNEDVEERMNVVRFVVRFDTPEVKTVEVLGCLKSLPSEFSVHQYAYENDNWLVELSFSSQIPEENKFELAVAILKSVFDLRDFRRQVYFDL